MSRWQSYATFHELLDALVDANGLTYSRLAEELETKGGGSIPERTLRSCRRGDMEPTYAVVEGLVTTNVLNLDPDKLRSKGDASLTGEHRLALFTAAGLIDITPLSIQEWNCEVLANVRRSGGKDRAGRTLQWGDVMAKLLSFHLQGGRGTFPQIAAEIQRDGHPELFTVPMRISSILIGAARPTEAEREALARFASLNQGQITEIETWIDGGTLLSGSRNLHAGFAGTLNRRASSAKVFLSRCFSSSFW
jgi:hypothetical protein